MTSGPRYHEEISQARLTVAEVLQLYPSVNIPLGCLIQLLPPLAPRYYSIASSPLQSALRVALCVGVVEYAAPSHPELPLRHGVVSASIKGLFEPAILQCRVRPSPFRLPKDPMVPVVCVAAGTGLAPFRGFLEERRGWQDNGIEVGPMVMFFGCRTEDDYYYADEMSEFLALR
jgi:cytochrome P450/NADPH-cytochrome P450 reductase